MFKWFFAKSVKIVKVPSHKNGIFARPARIFRFDNFFRSRRLFWNQKEVCGRMQVIWLDELLLVNFVISALFLLAAGLLCGTACTGVRLCLGAAGAAASALILLVPALPAGLAFVYRIFTGCLVVAAAYGVPGLRGFARLCIWYGLLNLLLCGAVLLPGAHSNNLCLYLPLSPGRLLGCCAGVYALLQGVLYCFGRAGRRSFPAVLELGGARIPVRAFWDTGFSLQEPLSGRTVVLAVYPAVQASLPAPLCAFLNAYFAAGTALPPPELGVRLVPCSTVSGHCLLPAVPAQALCTRRARTQTLWTAFCAAAPPDGSWTLLLGTDTAQQLGLS